VLENTAADSSELNAAVEELTRSSHRLAEAMYQKTTSHGPQSAESTGADAGAKAEAGKKEEEVIDAEYVDVDENKNK